MDQVHSREEIWKESKGMRITSNSSIDHPMPCKLTLGDLSSNAVYMADIPVHYCRGDPDEILSTDDGFCVSADKG